MEIIDAFRQSSPTWDVILIAFLFVAGFFYAMSIGRMRLVVSLVSLYVGIVIFPLFPFMASLTRSLEPMQAFSLRALLFIALIFLIYLVLMRSAFGGVGKSIREGGWYQILFLSIFHMGLLVTVLLRFLPIGSRDTLAPIVKILFVNATAQFWWTVIPIAGLFLLKIFRRE